MIRDSLIRRTLVRISLLTQNFLVARAGSAVINQAPVAEFSAEVTGLSVEFTDESTDADGTIEEWDWDWGDGTAHGTTQNPTHVYTVGGAYTVRLTVTDDSGGMHFVEHEQNVRGLPEPTVLDQGRDDVDRTVYTANVIGAPVANEPIYVIVGSRTATQGVLAVTGYGLTWEQVETEQITSIRNVRVFRALGAAPSGGALTFTFTTTQIVCTWTVVQFADADATGTNGSGATVQAVKSRNAVANTGHTNTLAALEHPNNVHLAVTINALAPANVAHDAQFAELSEDGSTSFNMEVQWARGEVACSPTYDSSTVAMISVEVKAK